MEGEPGTQSSVKYDIYCPCNECKLSVILLFILTICLLTLAGACIFLNENSLHQYQSARFQSQFEAKIWKSIFRDKKKDLAVDISSSLCS